MSSKPLFENVEDRSRVKTVAAAIALHGFLAAGINRDEDLVERSFDLVERFMKRAEVLHDVAMKSVEQGTTESAA